MTAKFDKTLKEMFPDIIDMIPVGDITVTKEYPEDTEEEPIAEDISETEIATKIIEKTKKLRKKIGQESYHYAKQIIDLAEKLLDIHPQIEIVQLEESVKDDILIAYKRLSRKGSSTTVTIPELAVEVGIPLDDLKKELLEINDTNYGGLYLEPHDKPNRLSDGEKHFLIKNIYYGVGSF